MESCSGAVTKVGVVGFFQPALLPLLITVESVSEDPGNVRLHPDENIDALKSSLSSFGQTKPIVTRNGIVVAGNGTLRAAISLDWTHIAAVEFSGDERTAVAYAIADNRIPELAKWDQEKLDAQLAALSADWASDGLTYEAPGLDAEFVERAVPESLPEPEPSVPDNRPLPDPRRFVTKLLFTLESDANDKESADKAAYEFVVNQVPPVGVLFTSAECRVL